MRGDFFDLVIFFVFERPRINIPSFILGQKLALRFLPREVGFRAVDEETFVERCPPEEHTELHVLSIGEADFDFQGFVPDFERSLDEGPTFFMATGVTNNTIVRNDSLGVGLDFVVTLDGVNGEPHPILAVLLEDFILSSV